MANLLKLKQIEGAVALKSLVDSINSSYEASKVMTTVSKGEGLGNYNLTEYLQELVNADSDLNDKIEAVKSLSIKDFVKTTGTFTGETATITFPDNVVVGSYEVYTEDNQPIYDADGNQLKISNTGVFSGVPSKAVIETVNDEKNTVYKPITEGNVKFKCFPVATYTLGTIGSDYLLDNEEMKVVYYAKAIDELALNLSKNEDVVAAVVDKVGNVSVETAINNVVSPLANRVTTAEGEIDAVEGRLDTLEGSGEGSVSKTVNDAIDTFNTTTVSPLSDRVGTAEASINELTEKIEGEGEGSVKSIVNSAITDYDTNTVQPLATRVTTAENEIDAVEGRLDTLEVSITKDYSEVVTVGDNQTTINFASSTDVDDSHRIENVVVLVNGIAYTSGSAFTVLNKTITWIPSNSFALESTDEVVVNYSVVYTSTV